MPGTGKHRRENHIGCSRSLRARLSPLLAWIGLGLALALDDARADVTVDGGASTSYSADTSTGIFYIGNTGAGTVSISGGTISSSTSYLGYNSTGSGTASVSGGAWTSNGTLAVGNFGSGTLTISDSGIVTNYGAIIGYNSGSTGSASVSGGTWTITNSLIVGNAGTGTLTVSGSGAVTSDTGYIGFASGSMGTVSVSGGSWTNRSNLYVGVLGSATMGLSGSGSITDQNAFIGNSSGGSGAVTVSGGAWTSSDSLFVGYSGSGAMTVTGGAVNDADGYIGTSSGGSGTASVSGGTWANSSNLYVGYGSNGSLALSGTGSVSASSGYIGYSTTGSGAVSVSGGSWTNRGSLIVGEFGGGTLTISGTGSVSDTTGYIGNSSGGSGTVTVSGGTWANSGNLIVGNSGAATLTISGTGSVSDSSGVIGYNSGSTGTVSVSGGTWTTIGSFTVGASGTGTLTISGTGLVSDSNGDIGVSSGGKGTVSVSGGTWANSVFLYVGDSGTGTLTISGSGSVSASSGVIIANNGTSKGTLNFGAAAGSSATTAGTLTTPSISFGAGTGGILFNTTSNVALSSVISGNGTVTLDSHNTGTATLSGANTYSGATTVNGGTLEVSGSLSSSAVTVNGGTLRGSGTITQAVVVNAGGGIAAGSASSVGTLHVGNLTLNNGSTTTLRVNSIASYDQIAATGTVTLGGTLNLVLGTGLLQGDTLTLIQAGTLSGSFGSTAVNNSLNNALTFSTSVTTGANGTVNVTAVATQQSFAPFAASGNGSAVARNLDRVVNDSRMADLIRALNALPGTALPSAFTQISPVQQTLTAGTSLAVSRMATGTLQNRMDNIRAGSTGLSIDQVNLIDSDLPASALLAGTDMSVGQGVKILAPDPKNKWGFFLATDGNFGDVDGQTTQSSYHGVGLTAGADYRLDRAFTVGFAAGYDWSKTDFDHSGSNSAANSVRFGPYATWKDQTGDWLDMNVGGAHHWYDSNRQGFGGTAVSSTTGLEFDSGMKFGHDFKIKDWTLTPTFGLDYMRLMIDGYTESGSLAPLAIQDQTTDSFRTNLGGTVGYTFTSKGVRWTPYVSLGWAHELLDASSAVNARFASGAGDVFAAQGDSLGHDSATFGTGIRGAFTDSLSAVLSYSGEANDTYQNHAFEASLRVAF